MSGASFLERSGALEPDIDRRQDALIGITRRRGRWRGRAMAPAPFWQLPQLAHHRQACLRATALDDIARWAFHCAPFACRRIQCDAPSAGGTSGERRQEPRPLGRYRV